MSKIMRQLYAEARAAREAAARARERPAPAPATTVSASNDAAPSSIGWWTAQYVKAGNAAVGAATTKVPRPMTPRELLEYRSRQCQASTGAARNDD